MCARPQHSYVTLTTTGIKDIVDPDNGGTFRYNPLQCNWLCFSLVQLSDKSRLVHKDTTLIAFNLYPAEVRRAHFSAGQRVIFVKVVPKPPLPPFKTVTELHLNLASFPWNRRSALRLRDWEALLKGGIKTILNSMEPQSSLTKLPPLHCSFEVSR